MSPEHNRRVAVVVLGDFGRSPRMQYHALALADSRIDVDVVAYAGSAPLPALREHPRVRLHLLPPPRLWRKASLPSALVVALMVLRICKQSLQLLWLLGLRVPKPDFILVQNPPAIPTLLVGPDRGPRALGQAGHRLAQLWLFDARHTVEAGKPRFAPGAMVRTDSGPLWRWTPVRFESDARGACRALGNSRSNRPLRSAGRTVCAHAT